MESAGLLSALRRHLTLVAGLTLLGLIAAIVASVFLPRSYEAQATLFLRVQSASTSLYERSQFALQRVQSYPALLDSPTLLKSVIDELGLDESTSELASRVSAENPTNTVLLNVTASASTPSEAADIANAAASALAKNVNALENNETSSKNAVTLVQQIQAQAPRSASSPNMSVVLGLGVLGGFVLGALIALLVERFRPRVFTVADVRRVTGLPVIAQLPRSRRRRPAATANAAVNLRTLTKGSIPQALVLAPVDRRSSQSGSHLMLAYGLAQTGRRVLALTSPGDATGEYGVSTAANAPGVSEVLAGRTTVDATRVRASAYGFDIVPTGDVAVAPTSFDLERTGETAVTPLFTGHDVTVLQAAVDARPLDLETAGRLARSTVLVVSHGASEHDVRHLAARVRALDITAIGVLLTDVSAVTDDLLETWVDSDFLRITTEPRYAVAPGASAAAGTGPVDVVGIANR